MEETKLTPKQWVLVRDWDSQEWRLNIFSHYSEEWKYVCVASVWKQCIPYENNEHLLNTTDEPKEPHNPQDGDFVTYVYESGTYVSIYKNNYNCYYASYQTRGSLNAVTHYDLQFQIGYTERRLATESERQQLIDALHEAGKDWDAENKKVVDYVKPYQPEDGDVVFSGYKDVHGEEACHWVAIVKRGNAESYEAYCGVAWENSIKLWTKPEWCDSQEYTRPATDEEREVLISFLHKNGKDWDAENKKVVDWKWQPQKDEMYYCPRFNSSIGSFGPYEVKWLGLDDEFDKFHYERGWAFRTEKECQALCDKLNQAIANI